MKRIIPIIILCCLPAAWAFSQKAGTTMYVGVQSAQLKSSTGFFASNKGLVRLGDRVTLLSVKGKWVQVRSLTNSSLNGWIAYSSLTTKAVSGTGAQASTKELALAGKGFSEEVEKEYKTGKDLNYTAVDALEKVTVNDRELLAFIQEGHLAEGE